MLSIMSLSKLSHICLMLSMPQPSLCGVFLAWGMHHLSNSCDEVCVAHCLDQWHWSCCSDPWSWAEDELRRLETPKDSFEVWQQKLLQAVKAYPSKEKLVGSMARKINQCLDRGGGPIDDWHNWSVWWKVVFWKWPVGSPLRSCPRSQQNCELVCMLLVLKPLSSMSWLQNSIVRWCFLIQQCWSNPGVQAESSTDSFYRFALSNHAFKELLTHLGPWRQESFGFPFCFLLPPTPHPPTLIFIFGGLQSLPIFI